MKPAKPVMHPVKSSSISHYGYDAATKTLAVQFHSGAGSYHYSGVEQSAVDALLKAPSFGKHLQENIVGKYKHVRQNPKA